MYNTCDKGAIPVTFDGPNTPGPSAVAGAKLEILTAPGAGAWAPAAGSGLLLIGSLLAGDGPSEITLGDGPPVYPVLFAARTPQACKGRQIAIGEGFQDTPRTAGGRYYLSRAKQSTQDEQQHTHLAADVRNRTHCEQ